MHSCFLPATPGKSCRRDHFQSCFAAIDRRRLVDVKSIRAFERKSSVNAARALHISVIDETRLSPPSSSSSPRDEIGSRLLARLDTQTFVSYTPCTRHGRDDARDSETTGSPPLALSLYRSSLASDVQLREAY